MLSDIAIQKTKISFSVEKLQVHFKTGIGGDNKIAETADDMINELNLLNDTVKEQTASLESCLTQIDQYQQVGLHLITIRVFKENILKQNCQLVF